MDHDDRTAFAAMMADAPAPDQVDRERLLMLEAMEREQAAVRRKRERLRPDAEWIVEGDEGDNA